MEHFSITKTAEGKWALKTVDLTARAANRQATTRDTHEGLSVGFPPPGWWSTGPNAGREVERARGVRAEPLRGPSNPVIRSATPRCARSTPAL